VAAPLSSPAATPSAAQPPVEQTLIRLESEVRQVRKQCEELRKQLETSQGEIKALKAELNALKRNSKRTEDH
jgi:peptidoglycan hydrolase CwlO-like protein